MTVPLFSVVLPTYNRPSEVIRAIDSVKNQDLTDFELIIVDDGSEAPYIDHIRAQSSTSRIRTIRLNQNRGPAAARNAGMAVAAGKYISFLDDDDQYEPDFLRLTFIALSGTLADVGASWSSETNPAKRTLRRQPFGIAAASPAPGLIVDFVKAGAGCGLTVKAECLRRLGGFNEAFRVGEDTEFFIRMLALGYRPIQLKPDLVKIGRSLARRLTISASDSERARVCRWIRATYADFLSEHPELGELLQPNTLSNAYFQFDEASHRL